MNTRNERYNEQGTIDCEIEHPEFGWIPFTASSDDVDENGRKIHAELILGTVSPYTPKIPTQAEIQAKLDQTKEQQKALLRQLKIDSLLSSEFAEIDTAKTEQEIKQIKLRG